MPLDTNNTPKNIKMINKNKLNFSIEKEKMIKVLDDNTSTCFQQSMMLQQHKLDRSSVEKKLCFFINGVTITSPEIEKNIELIKINKFVSNKH